jgi:translation elongation factor aEF-1 beta
MAFALIKIKIMPDSPKAKLDEIEKQAKLVIEKNKGTGIRFEREPIAFGLTAVIVLFGIDESESSDPILESLQKLDHVSSAETIDFRRAIG